MRLRFLGAARTVTGSHYLLELSQASLLVDCGMTQGMDAPRTHGTHRFDFEPSQLDIVLLTHAHIDHSGMLPRLWKLGFRGRIFATRATTDLCAVMLADSAKIQQEDAEFELRKWRKGQQATPPPAPLYTIEDAGAVMDCFVPVDYDAEVEVAPGVSVRWVDAGHILGAASIELWAADRGATRKLVFSGDIGNPNRPLLRDPTTIADADFVVMESTYGNRAHPPEERIQTKLADAINAAVREHGHILVPSFAVGRTQELLYRLDQMLSAGAIPHLPVYVDSPLASQATEVFEHHRECYDEEALALLAQGNDPISFPGLRFVESVQESMSLNQLRKPAIIISASGMCQAGRIRHHLHHHLEHGNDVILFVGWQAAGTLGRLLVDRVPRVKLFGRDHRVRARIVSIRGLSAHADQPGLLAWVRAIDGVRTVFVTHGEEQAALTFAQLLETDCGLRPIVPHHGEAVDLLDDADLSRRQEQAAAELATFTPEPPDEPAPLLLSQEA